MRPFICPTCGKRRVHEPAEKSFPRQASEAIPSQQGGKKAFFNGEKWEAGDELAVAARIIDGNCLGTRLRFIGRTTHGGWKPVCARGMKDMRQHFDSPASLIDRVSSQMQGEKKKKRKNYQTGFGIEARMDSRTWT